MADIKKLNKDYGKFFSVLQDIEHSGNDGCCLSAEEALIVKEALEFKLESLLKDAAGLSNNWFTYYPGKTNIKDFGNGYCGVYYGTPTEVKESKPNFSTTPFFTTTTGDINGKVQEV